MLLRWSLLAVGLGLAGAPEAAAFCESPGPHLASPTQLPLGCPVYVYAAQRPDFEEPALFTLRGGSYVLVTGSRARMDELVFVEETLLDCDLTVANRVDNQHPFTRYTLTPNASVQVGDQIGVGEGWLNGIEITAAGACPSLLVPKPVCTAVPPCAIGQPFPFEDDFDGGGCAAGGGAGLLPVALALLLRRKRRR